MLQSVPVLTNVEHSVLERFWAHAFFKSGLLQCVAGILAAEEPVILANGASSYPGPAIRQPSAPAR
jgi:hypothetical protein